MPRPALSLSLLAALAGGAFLAPVLSADAPTYDGDLSDNPRAQLGRQLFFDPILSRDRTVSCASCHQPARAFADDRALSLGVDGRLGTRNTPSVMNSAGRTRFFWDGRSETLEEQALAPIANPLEMDLPVDDAVARLRADPAWVARFQDAYSAAPSARTLGRALAAYQKRIALSDGITPSRLPSLLALCRQEEPEVEIRLFEVPLSQQIKGMNDDLYDVGFAQSDEVGEGIATVAVWSDPLMVAVPARHPLLRHKRIPLEEVLRHPLVLCDPQVCEGYARQVDRVLRRADMEPLIAERVASFDLMMALVAAGFALGLAGAPHITGSREPGVVARPLAGRSPMLTTYVLYREGESSDVLARFIERVQAIESPEGHRSTPPVEPDPQEEFEP